MHAYESDSVRLRFGLDWVGEATGSGDRGTGGEMDVGFLIGVGDSKRKEGRLCYVESLFGERERCA